MAYTGVRVQWRRPEHSPVTQRAQSVPGKRTNQVVQVRLRYQSKGRRGFVTKQTVHQGRRTLRAGARTSQKPP